MAIRNVLPIWLIAPSVFSGILFGCVDAGSRPVDGTAVSGASSGIPAQLDDGWAVSSAEGAGLNACLLDSMAAAIRRGTDYSNVHAVLIVKGDRLVYEQYFSGTDRRWRSDHRETVSITFDRDTLHDTRSVGKSITSALVGIAVGSGAISSLDEPLASYFPEHASLVTGQKQGITLRHALTMTAGLDWNEDDVPYTDPANDEEQMGVSADPAGFVLSRAVVGEPGRRYYYNGGLPTLLGFVVSRATGRPFGAYAREKLFEPLGISSVEWGGPSAWADIPELEWKSSEAWAVATNPAGALWMRPRDFAKFGSLYLHEGRWNGRQVIPSAWVAESTRRRVAVKDSLSDYGEHGYGYFWWHDRFHTDGGDLEVHSAVGNGEQRIFVIPALDLVVVHLAGRYNEDADWMSERLLLNYVVPAAREGRCDR